MNLIVKAMLSFELSAIDIVLMIAVLILLVLYITKKPATSKTEPQSHVEKPRKLPENLKPMSRVQKAKPNVPRPQTNLHNCVHHFGYLRNMSENTQIPEECFGCQKVMRCMFKSELQEESCAH